MRLVFPNNFITRLIIDAAPIELKGSIEFKPSSLLTSEILKDDNAAALIPVTDLLKYHDLFVSKSFGISFEGSLCNSFIYFSSGEWKINEIYLSGDITTLEAIFVKILFKEIYDSETEIKINTSSKLPIDNNSLLVGDENFHGNLLSRGISFSDEIIELISLPFVNFILASKNEKKLKEINEQLPNIQNGIYESIEQGKIDPDFSEAASEYIKKNVSSIVLNLDTNDIEGINQLIRLPYYHGIVKEIIEIKLV